MNDMADKEAPKAKYHYILSRETRMKISNSHLGKKLSAEHKLHISEGKCKSRRNRVEEYNEIEELKKQRKAIDARIRELEMSERRCRNAKTGSRNGVWYACFFFKSVSGYRGRWQTFADAHSKNELIENLEAYNEDLQEIIRVLRRSM